MATNHTENYNLNLWEPTDKFVREEFNENTSKLDAAIKAVDTKANTKADQTALTALTQTVAAKADQTALTAETNARTAAVNSLTQTVAAKAQIVVGTYTGNGVQSRTIYLGYAPKVIIVCDSRGYFSSNSSYHGGVAYSGHPAGDNHHGYSVEIVANGFTVAQKTDGNGYGVCTNTNNQTYHYIAFV